ncbi:hypothetical protein ACHAXT_007222 [Thalassiosira profunda]
MATAQSLRGYRLAVLRPNETWDDAQYRSQGASVLYICSEEPQARLNSGANLLLGGHTPTESEADFQQWWLRESNKAQTFGQKLVVLKEEIGRYSHYHWYSEAAASRVLYQKWLQMMEESDFFDESEDQTRVICTTRVRLRDAVHTREGLLTDEWDDDIERGEPQKVLFHDSDSDSDSGEKKGARNAADLFGSDSDSD